MLQDLCDSQTPHPAHRHFQKVIYDWLTRKKLTVMQIGATVTWKSYCAQSMDQTDHYRKLLHMIKIEMSQLVSTLAPFRFKADFHLQKIFRGQERNRKTHGHARGSRDQENFPFRSVPRKVESSSTFSFFPYGKDIV